jgi:exonuclease SbcC
MNNSLIYLSRIGITNFRAYGPDFVLDLPSGPGVTLIAGPNGLGKTTFFEAAEWALTGSASRLLSLANGNPGVVDGALTSKRKGVVPGSHSVHLEFTSGQKVLRSAASKPKKEDIVKLLAAPEWNTPVGDIGAYLALTHFVPQSQRVQFLHQNFGEQWEMLKLPAGAEELERLRLLLGNQGVSRAFNAAVEAVAKAIDERRKMQKEFETLAKELDELRNLAQAGASMAPDNLRQELASIQNSLSQKEITDEQAAQPESLLAVVGESLAYAEARLAHAKLRIEPAKALLAQWSELRGKDIALVARIGAVEERLIALQSAVSARQKEILNLRGAIATIETQRNFLRGRVDALNSIVEAVEFKNQLAPTMAAAAERLKAVEAKMALQAGEKEELEKKRAELHELLAQLSDTRRSLHLYSEKRELWYAYQAAAGAAIEASQKRDLTEGEINLLRKKDATLMDHEKECQAKIATLNEQLESSRQSAKAIDQAVSNIAAHLSDADKECPVCKHHYPTPGELKQLAAQSAALANADFPAIAKAMEDIREDLRVTGDSRRTVLGEIQQLVTEMAAYGKVILEGDQKRQILESDPALQGALFEDIPVFIESRLLSLTDLQNNLAGRIEQFESSETIEARLRETNESRAQSESEYLSAKHDREELDRRSSQIESIIVFHNELLIEIGTELEVLRAARDKSLQQIVQIESGLSGDNARLGEHLNNERDEATLIAEVRKLNAESAAELSRVKAASDELLGQWNALRISKAATDGPSEASLAAFQGRVSEEESKLQELRLKHQGALEGFKRWRNNQMLAVVEERMRSELAISNSKTVEDHRAWIANEVCALEGQHTRARKAKEMAEKLKAKMLHEAESFTSSILMPLNRRVAALHAMMSPSYEFGFDFNVRQHRSRTDFGMQMRVAEGDGPIDPYLRLSEGQLSALNLTVLIAASTAYRWSRWRALLLDDPLQHNDLIHAAAFLDVVRSLVKGEGYQVIISTHDMENANFIERKCRTAGIPVQRCWLLSDSEDGVRYEAQRLHAENSEAH